jgi:hydrogenase maturation factor
MKMHLISLNLGVWIIVHIGVEFPDEDEEPDFEQLQPIHRNAQASSVLLS